MLVQRVLGIQDVVRGPLRQARSDSSRTQAGAAHEHLVTEVQKQCGSGLIGMADVAGGLPVVHNLSTLALHHEMSNGE